MRRADDSSRLPATGYLDGEMPHHVPVLDVLHDYDFLAALQDLDPCVVGTLAIGLAVDDSDIDIICEAHDQQDFVDRLNVAFGHHDHFSVRVRHDTRPWRVIALFEVDGWPVEIFGEPRPVVSQTAYRHMVIQHRLLDLGGAALHTTVMDRRREGAKTQSAFASALGLSGDPYLALLDLESLTDGEVQELVASI